MKKVVVALMIVVGATYPSPSWAQATSRSGDKVEGAPVAEPLLDPSSLEGGVRAASYVVGPGDKLNVVLWGLQQLHEELEVTAEGRLFVPRAGVFDAGGKTLTELRSSVEAKLHALYPGLQSALTLSKPRTFLVHVTGAVARPGTYAASPLVRVSAMLPKAGGALPNGSLRRVEIRRRGVAEPIHADLVRFTLFGQVDQDPQLLDGDTLYVPTRQLTVEVTGGVRRPGTYELIAQRTVEELIELAGGLDTQASNVRPLRVTSRAAGDDVGVRSVSLSVAPSTPLKDGDLVHVPVMIEQRPTVLVQGAVVGTHEDRLARVRPAGQSEGNAPDSGPREVSVRLPYVEHEGVRDLLAQAGGLEPWADARHAYLSRRDAKGAARAIPVDLAVLQTGLDDDVPVKPGDMLVVPVRREQVLVAGAVQRPGFYSYSGDLRPRDYLGLAGGATRFGASEDARVIQNGHARPLTRVDSVEPGDVITVPERKFSAADWTTMALIVGNIGVGIAALTVAAVK